MEESCIVTGCEGAFPIGKWRLLSGLVFNPSLSALCGQHHFL